MVSSFSPTKRREIWNIVDIGKPNNQSGSTYGLSGIVVCDVDQDNITELYLSSFDNGHIYRLNFSNEMWTIEDIELIQNVVSASSYSIQSGDADDDGSNEIYTGVWSKYNATTWKNSIYQLAKNGTGWDKTNMGATGRISYGISIGDGDNNDRKELFSADEDSHLYKYSKALSWNSQDIGNVSIPKGYGQWDIPYVTGVAVGDGDNDGTNEVYCSDDFNHIYKFYYNNSQWKKTLLGAPGGSIWHTGMLNVAIGDIDNDGKNEIVGCSELDAIVWMYKWNPDNGTWDSTKLAQMQYSHYPYNDAGYSLCVGDGNSDGKNEVYVGTFSGILYKVYLDNAGWQSENIGTVNNTINGLAIGSCTNDVDQIEIYAACQDGHVYQFYTDRNPPANPIVWSDSHPVTRTWYNQNIVHVLWKNNGSDISGIYGYSVLWDNSPTTMPIDIMNTDGSVHELYSKKLIDGNSWFFHIRVCDGALNWNKTATTFGPIFIDTTPPNRLKLTINDDNEYSNKKIVTLSISASDRSPGSGLGRMSFSNNGDNWSSWEPYCTTRSGWDLADVYSGGNDSDGLKSVYLKVKDLAGNEVPVENRTSDSIFLDRIAPSGLSIFINDNATYTAVDKVTLNLTAFDPEPASGLSLISFSNDGIEWSDWTDLMDTIQWSLTNGAGGVDRDGNKSVYFRVQDLAGNVGGPISASIFLDRKSPENLSILINGGAQYTNSSLADLAISASDPESGSSIHQMTLANEASSFGSWENFSTTKNAWSLTNGTGGKDTDGLKSVYLKVRDRAGNIGGPVNSYIFLDRVRPGKLSIVINEGAAYTTNPSVNLSINANDEEPSSGIWTMQFSDDSITWSSWELFNTSKTYNLPGSNGQKNVHIRVKDHAGNIADQASASIILDTTSPVISNVQVTGITDKSAIVSWSTSEDADSGIDYGISTAYGSSSLDNAYITYHSLLLKNLSPSTTYHFRIYSRDRAGNPPAFTGDYIFITSGTPDTTPPTISNVQVLSVTDRLAVIAWITNEPADSAIDYGTSVSYGQRVSYQHFVLMHSLAITGLSPSTIYHFRVSSKDPSGNGPSFSKNYFFTTASSPDTTPPVISNIKVTGISDRLAVITWETNEAANSAIDYGTSTVYDKTTYDNALVVLHQLILTSLNPSTTYHFNVKSTDAAGNGPSISVDHSFTTSASPDTSPPSIFNIQIAGITESSATVIWETDEIANGLVYYGPTNNYGVSAEDPAFVLSHSILLQSLNSNKVYHIEIRSTDPSGNIASSGDYAFRTKKTGAGADRTPPVISGLQILGISDSKAVVLWVTDEIANSEVEYGNSTTYGLTATDPSYVFIHSIVLETLTPSTIYHLRVRSTDVFGNGPAISADLSFTTLVVPDLTPPMISDIHVTNITNNSVIISWSTDEPSNSIVEYGTDTHYGFSITSHLFVLNHSIQLRGLTPGITYHFRVMSADPSGNEGPSSTDGTFTTWKNYFPPGHKPNPNNLSVENAGGVLSWLIFAIVLISAVFGILLYSRRSLSADNPLKPERYISNTAEDKMEEAVHEHSNNDKGR
jgi:hypothetical protein